jgi:hypothetical protein
MTEIKPVALKRGMPKAERNGLFGAEDVLIERGHEGRPVVAIVTYVVPKVMHDEIEDERWPILEHVAIEPLFDDDAETAAVALRDAQYKARTGADTLDLEVE